MTVVQLSEIQKKFGSKPVLRGIDLNVQSGDYLVLLGKSGCGKTTLLNILAGLLDADAGSVHFDGRDMSKVVPRKRDVSMVFQGDALYPHLPVERSLRLSLKGVSGKEAEQNLHQAVQLTGIGDLLERKPHQLSGGQRRRAAVAKAIVRRAGVRLLDEPLSALDMPVRYSIAEQIMAWHLSIAGTTIHVTHDGQEAMRMADRIAVIDEGRVVQCDVPDVIYRKPASKAVALAIGIPPMNFVRVSRTDAGWSSEDSDGMQSKLKADIATNELTIGFRPNDCKIGAATSSDIPGIRLKGIVSRSETIEGQPIVTVLCGQATIRASVSCEQNTEVTLFVHEDDLHFFDTKTSARLDD